MSQTKPRKAWLKELGYKVILRIATEGAAKWLLFLGAGIIAAFAYKLDTAFNYQTWPPHAIILVPTISALAGFSVLLATTFILHKKNLLQRTGFRRAFPVRDYDKPTAAPSERHLDKAISAIRRIIRETPAAETCRLLLVSGFYYLGAPTLTGSPRHFLEDVRVPDKVRVLLLNPYAEVCQPCWARRRAGETGIRNDIAMEDYLRGIKRVAQHLITLHRDEGLDVKVGFYNTWPSWQLFLNSREGIIQPVTTGRHSQYNSLYYFQYTSGSLFVPFQRHFEVLWQEWEDHLHGHREFYEREGIILPRA